jgi:hypothetical protein
MAAKRLGSALGNVEGTSNQLLRVKTDESGFEFVNPATIPAYTLSNITTDRVIDGTTTTIDEIARVLGTLIQDMTDAGLTGAGGISAFTWSTSEQVWPFEKDSAGRTLYCKEVNTGTLPTTNGESLTNHNISSFDPAKLYKMYAKGFNASSGITISLPNVFAFFGIKSTQIYIYVQGGDLSSYTSTTYLIYAK